MNLSEEEALQNRMISRMLEYSIATPDASDMWVHICDEEGLDPYDTIHMNIFRGIYMGMSGITFPEEENKKSITWWHRYIESIYLNPVEDQIPKPLLPLWKTLDYPGAMY